MKQPAARCANRIALMNGFFDIWAIGCDYDGESTVDGLKKLVDSLVEMSQKARDCLHDGKLFPADKE